MSERTRFLQQQQLVTGETSTAGAMVRFTEKEKTYFALYDAYGAWYSFIAVLPFLSVTSWALAVLFVTYTI